MRSALSGETGATPNKRERFQLHTHPAYLGPDKRRSMAYTGGSSFSSTDASAADQGGDAIQEGSGTHSLPTIQKG